MRNNKELLTFNLSSITVSVQLEDIAAVSTLRPMTIATANIKALSFLVRLLVEAKAQILDKALGLKS